MNKIFDEVWLESSAKKRKEILEKKLLGLRPVLVYLDDEEEALEVFEARCEEHGLEAVASTDPHYLLNYITRNKSRILLIISDYNMPFNGFEFRKKLLEVSDDIPFYILSGYVDREMALEGVKYKVTDFINKPMSKDVFLQLLVSEGEKQAGKIIEDYEILKSFTDDVVNISSELEQSCLYLESDPHDLETISRIFGLVHTVKGSSSFFEPRTLHLFAHAFEEKLKLVQSGKLHISSRIISAWLRACDVIKTLNDEFISGEHQDHDLDELKAILDIPQALAESSGLPRSADLEKKNQQKEQKTSEIKVSMQVLNEFTQVSGELTVIRNMINKVVSSIEKKYPTDKDVQVLSELLGEMHKINSDMQGKIVDIRRVPASHLTKPLQRNFRDTSKALDKEVDFEIEGEDLLLDNTVAETLSKCLVHLMRNSLDHGIEGPEVRAQSGKPSRGKLRLKFESNNDTIHVSLSDDGQGINSDKIRQKVIANGLRSAAEANTMTEEELHLMIFEPGFSTASAVTEYSGRGVGMSMVKDSVTQQNGTISIRSARGQGSQFILSIPVPKSVMISNCLFVQSGEMILGIPQESIIRLIDCDLDREHSIEKISGGEFLRFSERLIPVLSLSTILELGDVCEEKLLLILETESHMFALKVGVVHDTEDAVLKPLQFSALTKLSLYKGGTFLADGGVGLVIDVQGIVKKFNLKKTQQLRSLQESTSSVPSKNIISFSLSNGTKLAVQEEEVFRIEVVPRGQVQKSGSHFVAPYRNTIITLRDLDPAFCPEVRELTNEIVLVVKRGPHYLGLVVSEVHDLLPVELNILPSLKKRKGVQGNILLNDKALPLIDVCELFEEFGIDESRVNLAA